MSNIYRFIFFAVLVGGVPYLGSSQEVSSVVYDDVNGNLRYVADGVNNYIPDFSYAGYKNGAVPLPELPVVKTISPIEGDNSAHIQGALDEIAAMSPDANGFRGALLLEAGTYEIRGTVTIPESGMVLRGVGKGTDPTTNTVLIGSGNTPNQRDIVVAGNVPGASWSIGLPSSESLITSAFVPAGSRSLAVTAPELYSVGSNVIVYHPSTTEWLASINFGDTAGDAPWAPGDIDIVYNRYVTAVDFAENKISLDAPIYDHFDRSLAQARVYVLNKTNLRNNIGIENLRIDIETAGELDEDHARNAIRLIGVEDCWVSNVTALNFIYAAVDTRIASRVTVRDCEGLEPHSEITGARRYNFAVGAFSNNILFENCHATEGRHSYVSNGTSSVSGIVFRNSTSDNDYSASEGHRRWSQGLLFDNITFTNPEANNALGLYNRGSFGTGHGWSSVHSVAWNVTIPFSSGLILQRPPGRQNYAIGCNAIIRNQGSFTHPRGFQELTNQTPAIPSLYARQLEERLNRGVPPDAPAKLTATLTGENVQLEWLDIASQETGYRVEVSMDQGTTYTEIAQLEADATSFLQVSPTTGGSGGRLQYRVYAVGTNGPSPFSNQAIVELTTNTTAPPIPGLRIYPNPADGQLFIEADSFLDHISVYDARGALFHKTATYEVLTTALWPSGTYYVRVTDRTGRSSIQQINKQ